MNAGTKPIEAGLWFVATPIGNARDITLRALDVLAGADVIAAEDTRNLRKLMDIHGIELAGRRIIPYHDHNGAKIRPTLIAALEEGKSVAYASDAGTPLVADPGFALARDAIAQGHTVTTAPGVSAMIAALTVSGLPTDRFMFAGFLPSAKGARKKTIAELAKVPATLVFYESPRRLHHSLANLREILGDERQVSICRELTKKFEEVIRGPLGALCENLKDRNLKGEIALVIDRNRQGASVEDMDEALRIALETMTLKDAAAHVAAQLELPRRQVYQAGLEMDKDT